MKMKILNGKKKLLTFFLVLTFWILLFQATAAITDGNFLHFKSPEGQFEFSYPSSFILSEKDFLGSEILYHIEFQEGTTNSRGFVQVWNLPGSLSDFLQKSKASSMLNYVTFLSKAIKIHQMPGYSWEYTLLTQNNQLLKGMEVFLKKEDRMLRITYFVPMQQWNGALRNIFWKMAHSLKF